MTPYFVEFRDLAAWMSTLKEAPMSNVMIGKYSETVQDRMYNKSVLFTNGKSQAYTGFGLVPKLQ